MYDLLVSLFTDMSKTTEVVYKKKKKKKKTIRLIRDIVLVTLSRNILEIRLENLWHVKVVYKRWRSRALLSGAACCAPSGG